MFNCNSQFNTMSLQMNDSNSFIPMQQQNIPMPMNSMQQKIIHHINTLTEFEKYKIIQEALEHAVDPKEKVQLNKAIQQFTINAVTHFCMMILLDVVGFEYKVTTKSIKDNRPFQITLTKMISNGKEELSFSNPLEEFDKNYHHDTVPQTTFLEAKKLPAPKIVLFMKEKNTVFAEKFCDFSSRNVRYFYRNFYLNYPNKNFSLFRNYFLRIYRDGFFRLLNSRVLIKIRCFY